MEMRDLQTPQQRVPPHSQGPPPREEVKGSGPGSEVVGENVFCKRLDRSGFGYFMQNTNTTKGFKVTSEKLPSIYKPQEQMHYIENLSRSL